MQFPKFGIKFTVSLTNVGFPQEMCGSPGGIRDERAPNDGKIERRENITSRPSMNFKSVPEERLLAIQSLVLHWEEKHSDVVLSVDLSQKGNPVQLSFVGKYQRTPPRAIAPKDIFPIVKASLHCHIFEAVNTIWHQVWWLLLPAAMVRVKMTQCGQSHERHSNIIVCNIRSFVPLDAVLLLMIQEISGQSFVG